ncbi:MAG: sulfatase, partial [Actinomycetota bacterium]|nr:sulfatase [Actinomycetota bacterium]
YMNEYNDLYVPPGWDEWFAFLEDGLAKNQVNDDGQSVTLTGNSADAFANEASNFIRRSSANPEPFFVVIGTKAPHDPPEVADRYKDRFATTPLPKPSNFNEADVSDKPQWVRSRSLLSQTQIDEIEREYRARLRSMLSVEDLLKETIATLQETGELSNTYIVFTSDNGFHLGQHRLGAGKWTPYEEDIRVPLIVRGPGVPEGETLHHMVLNNDLAPTFADLAGAEPPSFVDGRSLKPLLTDDPTPLRDWRQRFVIESVAERSGVPHPPFITESTVVPLLTGDPLPGDWRRTSAASAQSSEEWGRPWLKALRTNNYLYVDYKTGEHELYDLRKDPHQLDNIYATAPPEITQRLETQLDALRQCSAEDCRTAESEKQGKRPTGRRPSGG